MGWWSLKCGHVDIWWGLDIEDVVEALWRWRLVGVFKNSIVGAGELGIGMLVELVAVAVLAPTPRRGDVGAG